MSHECLVCGGNVANTCGLFHTPLESARRLIPELPWDLAPIREGVEYIADVKIHKLMPGQWPCIPNWHCDFVPRDEVTLIEQPHRIDDSAAPMLMWLSGPPVTEFKDGRVVPIRQWVEFTQRDEHRGIAATDHCWRTFVRLAPVDMMRVGLPMEMIPASSDSWIRRHSQVYLDAEKFKW